ncbi:exosome complex protein Rrp42 [Candidatus Woesearchaeota archaeon]|nr:exosome complex protein Rrp42 [Candidatus Woesearchaeota archaeon]
MDNISREYLIKFLDKGKRINGRKFDELREIEVDYNVSKHAEGAARIKFGDTEVIVGVKLEVGEPFPDKPDEGTIIVGAEMLPLSSAEFEPGPPSVDSIELARVVDRAIRESKAIDFKKLCITKGEKVWMVLIDIYTINDDGNLQDASALATLAALKQVKIPRYDGKKVDYSEKTGKLPLLSMPVECSVVKIKDKLLSDPCFEEEKMMDARLTVGVTENNEICAMQKGGKKVLTIEDVNEMIEISLKNSEKLRKLLK